MFSKTTLVLNKINLSFFCTFGNVNNNTILRRIRLNHFNGYNNSFITKIVNRVINTRIHIGDNTKKTARFETVIFESKSNIEKDVWN